MKVSALIFTLAVATSPALASIVDRGECGPHKPSLRVIGASGVSSQDAVNDSASVARKECKAACGNLLGSQASYCGVHQTNFQQNARAFTRPPKTDLWRSSALL